MGMLYSTLCSCLGRTLETESERPKTEQRNYDFYFGSLINDELNNSIKYYILGKQKQTIIYP